MTPRSLRSFNSVSDPIKAAISSFLLELPVAKTKVFGEPDSVIVVGMSVEDRETTIKLFEKK